MSEEIKVIEEVVSEAILPAPKKRRAKSDKSDFDLMCDAMIDSAAKMSVRYENEMRVLRVIIAALALKNGGKILIGHDMAAAASSTVEDLSIVEDGDSIKITV